MTAVLIILAKMSVPLAAILCFCIVKLRALEHRGAPPLPSEQHLRALVADNAELRARIEVLETIATAPSPSSSSPPPSSPPPSPSPSQASKDSQRSSSSSSSSSQPPTPTIAHVSLTRAAPVAPALVRR